MTTPDNELYEEPSCWRLRKMRAVAMSKCDEETITAPEAAKLLGVKQYQITAFLNRGDIKFYLPKTNKCVRHLSLKEVLAYKEKRREMGLDGNFLLNAIKCQIPNASLTESEAAELIKLIRARALKCRVQLATK